MSLMRMLAGLAFLGIFSITPAQAIDVSDHAATAVISTSYFAIGKLPTEKYSTLDVQLVMIARPLSPTRQKTFHLAIKGSYFAGEAEFLHVAETLTKLSSLAAQMSSQDQEYTEVTFQVSPQVELGFYQKGREQTCFMKSGTNILTIPPTFFLELRAIMDQAQTRMNSLR